jgi:hypothetical protein
VYRDCRIFFERRLCSGANKCPQSLTEDYKPTAKSRQFGTGGVLSCLLRRGCFISYLTNSYGGKTLLLASSTRKCYLLSREKVNA